MGIFQADVNIRTAIELGLQDLRENPWLIDHMLEDFVQNPYLKDKYGQKQIDACKEWFANNQIDIYMRMRNDKDRLPCVTITLGTSGEKEDMKTMADQSVCTTMLLPQKINKPIPYIMKPFTPTSYDPMEGLIGVPASAKGIDNVVAGQIIVNPSNGQGYKILDVGPEGIYIEPNLPIEAGQFGVVPEHQYYVARIEHTFFQETYSIGCHAHGDPQVLLWLHSIVLYCLLRYREGLLEANGFSQSVLNSGDMSEDPNYVGPGGEVSFVRFITLTGMVENSWIKSPRRVIENVALREKSNAGYKGGIKILSNSEPLTEEEETNVNWYPINSDDSDDE